MRIIATVLISLALEMQNPAMASVQVGCLCTADSPPITCASIVLRGLKRTRTPGAGAGSAERSHFHCRGAICPLSVGVFVRATPSSGTLRGYGVECGWQMRSRGRGGTLECGLRRFAFAFGWTRHTMAELATFCTAKMREGYSLE